MLIVLFSGPMAVGKSTVAATLISEGGLKPLSSSGYLRALAANRGNFNPDRTYLQNLGDSLDEETEYRWLLELVETTIESLPNASWLIDSVRKQQQVALFRERFGNEVLHVHFLADDKTIKARFVNRALKSGVTSSEANALFERSVQHSNEFSSRSLGPVSDLVIDLSSITAEEAAQKIIDELKRGAK